MLIPLLALTMMHPQVAEDLTTGTRLYHSCQAASRFADETNGNATHEKMDRVSECMAYIGGYIDGSEFRKEPLFCMGNATIGTSIKVYLHYMDANPTLLDSPRWVGASSVLWSKRTPVPKNDGLAKVIIAFMPEVSFRINALAVRRAEVQT